jgi:hypothetical protein
MAAYPKQVSLEGRAPAALTSKWKLGIECKTKPLALEVVVIYFGLQTYRNIPIEADPEAPLACQS